MKEDRVGAKERKIRSDKKIHVNPSLVFDVFRTLNKLAISCDTTYTKLAEDILVHCLTDPEWIYSWQVQYCIDTDYWIFTLSNEQKIPYDKLRKIRPNLDKSQNRKNVNPSFRQEIHEVLVQLAFKRVMSIN